MAAVLCITSLFSQAVLSSSSRAAKFTSTYTDLKKQCKAAFKSVGEGQDMPLRCKGYGGYEIAIDYSAASSNLRLQPVGGKNDDEMIILGMQPMTYSDTRKIEWRMADGKPFAVIYRMDKSKSEEATEMWQPQNKTGEALMVKGLKGYDHINFEVDAKEPDANAKARAKADAAYTGGSGH
jgi:hypothetical protein